MEKNQMQLTKNYWFRFDLASSLFKYWTLNLNNIKLERDNIFQSFTDHFI